MSSMHHIVVHASRLWPFAVAYIGPDQMLPLTSALGAIVGVLLMFWHRVVAWMRKGWQFCLRKLRREDV
jgi:undecaprenyl pyrophosphate phosphatase UppP